MINIIFRNLNETNVSITGDLPHFKILAKLMPTDEKEQESMKPYFSLDTMVSSNSSDDRSIGLSRSLKIK